MLSLFAGWIADAVAVGPVTLEIEPGRVSRGMVSAVLDAPLPQVLAAVMDCGKADQWVPDLVDTAVVWEKDGRVRCQGRTNLPWPLTDRQWQIDLQREAGPGAESAVVTFEYVRGSGNLELLGGRFALQAVDAHHTRVRCDASVDLGFWIPEPLLVWATDRVLPGILTGLERHAARPLGVVRR